jgi:hypothetical protein
MPAASTERLLTNRGQDISARWLGTVEKSDHGRVPPAAFEDDKSRKNFHLPEVTL